MVGMTMQRRTFLAGAPAAVMAQGSGNKVKFGIDLFSLRSQGWSPFEYLDYCAKQGAKVVHFSEIRFLGGLEKSHLEKVRDHARGAGIELEIGMLSICPTAARFDPKQGTAEEQLARMIDSARIAGAQARRASESPAKVMPSGRSTTHFSPGSTRPAASRSQAAPRATSSARAASAAATKQAKPAPMLKVP